MIGVFPTSPYRPDPKAPPARSFVCYLLCNSGEADESRGEKRPARFKPHAFRLNATQYRSTT